MNLTTRLVPFEEYLLAGDGLEPGWLYHGGSWERVVSEGCGVESRGLLTRDSDGLIVAATPVFFFRRLGLLGGGSPLQGTHSEFAGPRFRLGVDDSVRFQTIAQQHEILRTFGCVYVEWGVRGDASDSPPREFSALPSRNVVYSRRPTLVLNLARGVETVWREFEGRARNMIRKAEKNRVDVVPEPFEDELVVSYVDLVRSTFRSKGMALPHPLSLYKAIGRHLGSINGSKFFAARIDGRLVAGGLFLIHNDRMVYMSGSSTQEGNRSAANSLVQWAAIKFAISCGVTTYDFGGVGVDAIDLFKKSFGGQSAHHHRWVHASWLMRTAAALAKHLAKKGFLRLQ